MISSTPAGPPRWCATSCLRRISPPSMPSPWGGPWSTLSSRRCRRIPGSISPGIPALRSSRRSGRVNYSGARSRVRLSSAAENRGRKRRRRTTIMDAVTPKSQKSEQHSHVVRPANMQWQPTRFPGCEVKTLLFDRDSGLVTALMRFAPGAILPDHEHVKIEQTYVLEGKLVDREGPAAGLEVGPGERLDAGRRPHAGDVSGPQQVLRARWTRHRRKRWRLGKRLGPRVQGIAPAGGGRGRSASYQLDQWLAVSKRSRRPL